MALTFLNDFSLSPTPLPYFLPLYISAEVLDVKANGTYSCGKDKAISVTGRQGP
jgi:hypothetical protein